MRWQSLSILLGALAQMSLSFADGQPLNLAGKQFCPRNAEGYFGIGLVRKQNLYLATQELSGAKILMILRYKKGNAECAEVVDAIPISSSQLDFEFECADPAHPEVIIIGELSTKNYWKIKRTNHAWRVDLEHSKILPYSKRVTCQNVSYAGDDDGEDLASYAQKRSRQNDLPAKP